MTKYIYLHSVNQKQQNNVYVTVNIPYIFKSARQGDTQHKLINKNIPIYIYIYIYIWVWKSTTYNILYNDNINKAAANRDINNNAYMVYHNMQTKAMHTISIEHLNKPI